MRLAVKPKSGIPAPEGDGKAVEQLGNTGKRVLWVGTLGNRLPK